MSLNMYLGEVDAQTASITDICNQTIQGMEQVIASIDNFTGDVLLKGATYDSAKIYFSQTYRVIARGIILLCEELIRQNKLLPANFRAEVASIDIIEDELKEQIREVARIQTDMEDMSNQLIPLQPMVALFADMKRKLEKKLEDLYTYNSVSSSYFDNAIHLAESVVKGLASVKSSSGFSATSGTFSTMGLDMSWQTGIQKVENIKKGIDPKKIKELEAYNVYAVVYEGKDGKADILWHLEKDGKGVTSPELDTYLNKAGKYLDEEKYTIWSMADYTKRLEDGWREGINYQNGDEYNSFIKGTLSTSQYVADGYNWVSETGMYDLVLMAGLSYASYKATTLSNNTFKPTATLESHLKNMDPKVPRKRGIGGAHNSVEFYKNDVQIVSKTNSKVSGVVVVEYKMPKLNMDGTPTGEYGNKVFVKTIYDPQFISDQNYVKRGIEAANNAMLHTKDGTMPREWIGVDSKGVTWRGYYQDGEITSFFPEN